MAEGAPHRPSLDGGVERQNHGDRDERRQTGEDNDGEFQWFHSVGSGRKGSIAGTKVSGDKLGFRARFRTTEEY
jgi:hypothetical protein